MGFKKRTKKLLGGRKKSEEARGNKRELEGKRELFFT